MHIHFSHLLAHQSHNLPNMLIRKTHALFWLFSGCVIAGESGIYDELAKKNLRTGIDSLIHQGICSSYRSCANGRHAFYDRTESGVEVNFYEIPNTKTARKITADVIAGVISESCASIRINIYKADFEKAKSGFFKPTPLATAFLKGEEKCTR